MLPSALRENQVSTGQHTRPLPSRSHPSPHLSLESFALSLGAECFLIKPQKPEVFVDLLQNIIHENKGRKPAELSKSIEKDADYLSQYNKTLIQKLESKVSQLGEMNQALKKEMEQRNQAEEQTAGLIIELQKKNKEY